MTARTPRWWVLALLVGAGAVVGLDSGLVAVALPALQHDLHASSAQTVAVVAVHAVALAAVLPLLRARPARTVLLVGLVGLAVASALAALAPSAGPLLVARVGTGAGAAGVLSGTLGVLGQLFPDERARAVAVWAGATGVLVAAGPVLGGLLLRGAWWGSVLLVGVPLLAAALAGTAALVPPSTAGPRPAARRPPPVAAAVTAVTFGLLAATPVAVSSSLQDSGSSALGSGVHLLPLAVALVVVAPRTHALQQRWGPRAVCAAGLLLVAVGLLVLPDLVAVGLLLQGAGTAVVVAPAAAVSGQDLTTPRLLGGALGVAALAPVLHSGLRPVGLVGAAAAVLAALVATRLPARGPVAPPAEVSAPPPASAR